MCAAEMQAARFTVGDFALFTSYLANIGFSISLFGYMVFQHKRLKVFLTGCGRCFALVRKTGSLRHGKRI